MGSLSPFPGRSRPCSQVEAAKRSPLVNKTYHPSCGLSKAFFRLRDGRGAKRRDVPGLIRPGWPGSVRFWQSANSWPNATALRPVLGLCKRHDSGVHPLTSLDLIWPAWTGTKLSDQAGRSGEVPRQGAIATVCAVVDLPQGAVGLNGLPYPAHGSGSCLQVGSIAAGDRREHGGTQQ